MRHQISLKMDSKESILRHMTKNKWFYIFLVPAVLTTLVFAYLPIPGLIMAFQDFDSAKGFLGSDFVGFKNIIDIFKSKILPDVMVNTLAMSGLGFIFGFPIPIIIAILLNEINAIKFKKFVQTISYLPHFISWVVVAEIMSGLLNFRTGAVNNFISILGFQRIEFLTEPDFFWFIAVAIAIWKEMGWGSIIYLAAISGIDQEQYEAAVIDGANRLKRILYITLPGIMPTISLMLVLNAGHMIQGAGIAPGFEGCFNLSNPLVESKSQILDIWIYREGVSRMRYSFGAAVGFVLGVINMTFVLISNKIANKANDSGIF